MWATRRSASGSGGIPLLKDTETGTAPHTALSNTSPENIARTQETGSRNPAPCFFMFPITAPYPARKCESVSGSHQSDAIPTGASIQHPATYRRGIARSRTNLIPRLASSRRQPPSRQPWRATQPPTHSPRHFVNSNTKNPLHNQAVQCKIWIKR